MVLSWSFFLVSLKAVPELGIRELGEASALSSGSCGFWSHPGSLHRALTMLEYQVVFSEGVHGSEGYPGGASD